MNRDIPKPFREGFTDEQMALLQRYAKTLLAKTTVDTDALYGDDFDAAMRELARVTYTVAEHFDMPYVTATAYYADRGGKDSGHAYGKKRRAGEITKIAWHYPEEEEAAYKNQTAPICHACNGTGEKRFSDAAGSRDYKQCPVCKGKRYAIASQEDTTTCDA